MWLLISPCSVTLFEHIGKESESFPCRLCGHSMLICDLDIIHWLMGADFATQPRHTFLFMAAFLKYSTAPGSPRDWSSRPNSIIASLKVASRLVNAFLPNLQKCSKKDRTVSYTSWIICVRTFCPCPRKRWKHVDLIWSKSAAALSPCSEAKSKA